MTTLAKKAIAALSPVMEAALPFDLFKTRLGEMGGVAHAGEHIEYRFKPSTVVSSAEAFNHFTSRTAKKLGGHMKESIFVRASVNSEGSAESDAGCLWDARVSVQDDKIMVKGYGGPGKTKGEALVAYDGKGRLVEAVTDSLEGIIIEPGKGRILEMTAHVSEGFRDILTSVFGPSGA